MKKLIQSAIAVLLLATCNLQLATLHAQGTAFTYQGRLNDANGPANGSYDITFTGYGVATGGSSGGTLTNLDVAVTNGLFTTTLDTGNIPDGSPIWLELAVRTNGSGAFTPLSPRQAITPAPYAMFANTASNLVGILPASKLPAGTVTNGANGVYLYGNFIGDGGSLTNVNATQLGGLNRTNFWQLGGNTVQSNVDFIGSVNDAPLDLVVNNHRVMRLDTHDNVLGGSRYNQVQHSAIYGDPFSATIAGGGSYGGPNIVSAPFATVGGGAGNIASGEGAVVSGGGDNGSNGGGGNSAEAPASVVSGGFANHATGNYSTVGGGTHNTVSGLYSVIPGGNNNEATSDSSLAAGNRAKANHYGSFVWADGQDADFATTDQNQFLIRARNGVGINTNNPHAALQVNGTVIATNFVGNFTGSGAGLTGITGSSIVPGAVSSLGSPNGSITGALQIGTNGLVGIGTTNPATGLQIASSSPITTANVLFAVQDGTYGYTFLQRAIGVAVSGSLVAVSSFGLGGIYGSGVTLFDMSNPLAPLSQIGFHGGAFANLTNPQGMAWAGSNLVVAAYSSSSVTIISATNPASPVKLVTLQDGVGGWNYLHGARQVAVAGNLLAIGAESDSAVTLADISNPTAPVLRAVMQDGFYGFNNLNGVSAVSMTGNLLAIGSHADDAVTLVDVSDPSNPVKLAELKNGVGAYTNLAGVVSVVIAGNLLAIAAGNSSAVTLVDVTNPSNPAKLAELKDGVGGFQMNSILSIAISSSRLAVAGGSSMTLVDISNPSNPVPLTSVNDGVNGANLLNGAENVAFAGTNLVLTSYWDNGFTVFGFGVAQASLSSSGWVGIGTTQPKAALDVVGNVVVENANLFNVVALHLAFGTDASASGDYSTAIGFGCIASGLSSTALGRQTTASGEASTALGYSSTASGQYSIAMGTSTASGYASTAMGYYTLASGYASTALGMDTIASGDYSTAMGNAARATNNGSFVWADDTAGYYFTSTADNQFSVRANGGARIVGGGNLACPQLNLVQTANDFSRLRLTNPNNSWDIAAGTDGSLRFYNGNDRAVFDASGNVTVTGTVTANGVLLTSDRNAKENFATISVTEALRKVAALPITEWNYKSGPNTVRHVGPMAQDFKNAFGLNGDDDKHISVVDESGVALAAIQGLNEKVERGTRNAETQMEELKTENAELKARLEKLEQLLLEKK